MSENKILATVDGVNITEAEIDAFINTLTKDQQMYANSSASSALTKLSTSIFLLKWVKKKKWTKQQSLKNLWKVQKKIFLHSLLLERCLQQQK